MFTLYYYAAIMLPFKYYYAAINVSYYYVAIKSILCCY